MKHKTNKQGASLYGSWPDMRQMGEGPARDLDRMEKRRSAVAGQHKPRWMDVRH